MGAIERNGPSIAAEMRELSATHTAAGKHTVVCLAYERPNSRVFEASTLLGAYRKLASAINGKLAKRGSLPPAS